ncbi:hypothetical protein ACH5RR_017299 [Cinchona calisaya]|uniref:Uncharacterized protein n=1 Tax=Cinchona calisaya TaxID=153742 RepID=A0ABD2ZYC7_9GENT
MSGGGGGDGVWWEKDGAVDLVMTLHNSDDRSNEKAVSENDSGVGFVKDSCGDQQAKLVENVNCGGEEENGYGILSGFSRTEVTVIDTSFPSWKFEKMLFRKKNSWKVRDKKGKMINCGKKKKKKKKKKKRR